MGMGSQTEPYRSRNFGCKDSESSGGSPFFRPGVRQGAMRRLGF